MRALVIGIEYGDAIAPERCEQLAFSARGPFETAEALEMLGTRVGDETDGGQSDAGKFGHIARMIGAHLNHRMPMALLQFEQRQRHADVIVEITARSQCRTTLRENGGEHFFGAGLAVAAGDADQRRSEPMAPLPCGTLQRNQGVLHLHDREPRGSCALSKRSGSTGSCSNIQKLVAIETRTAQGDKQLAGGNAPRIGRHGSELPILAVQLAAAVAREFTQAAHQAASAYTARTTCWSLKRRRSVPIS